MLSVNRPIILFIYYNVNLKLVNHSNMLHKMLGVITSFPRSSKSSYRLDPMWPCGLHAASLALVIHCMVLLHDRSCDPSAARWALRRRTYWWFGYCLGWAQAPVYRKTLKHVPAAALSPLQHILPLVPVYNSASAWLLRVKLWTCTIQVSARKVDWTRMETMSTISMVLEK